MVFCLPPLPSCDLEVQCSVCLLYSRVCNCHSTVSCDVFSGTSIVQQYLCVVRFLVDHGVVHIWESCCVSHSVFYVTSASHPEIQSDSQPADTDGKVNE